MEDAAPGSGSQAAARSWWRTARQWRNWPLLVKLAAVLVVPVIVAVALSVLRVQNDIKLADSYADTERFAALRDELVPMVSVIQRERLLAVQRTLGDAEGQSGAYQQQIRSVDVVTSALSKLAAETPNLSPAATNGFRELTAALGGLGQLRQQVVPGADPTNVITGYGAVLKEALDFDRVLTAQFQDHALTGTAAALHDLQVAREQISLQQAVLLPALRRGELQENERDALIAASIRLDDRLDDCQKVAPPQLWQRYQQIVSGPAVTLRQDFVTLARTANTAPAPGPNRTRVKPTIPVNETAWTSSSDTTAGLMANVARGAAADLRSAAAALQDSLSDQAGSEAVLLLTTVLLAAAVGGVLGRYLLRSVGLLRRTALDVAGNRLPAAVASIREGHGSNITIDPVPLRTTEEFGQLARAFDAVHQQAVRSAAEEAGLRSNLRNIFINLSRRSQGLVERQLRLMEQLEHNEEDPDQLANLFKLDHLATRMRRNNENLMVLSGAELGRRFSAPVPLPDVLRAAVSEVEQYHRATVQSVPSVDVVGYAAGDLVRLVAELVENATSFSPPDSKVLVRGQRYDDGQVLIEILDRGIGMGDAELLDANERVAAGGSVDVPISRQMGLFVVGNLANRHGIRVKLAARKQDLGGLRATVLVPADLLSAVESDDRSTPVSGPPAAERTVGAAAATNGNRPGGQRGPGEEAGESGTAKIAPTDGEPAPATAVSGDTGGVAERLRSAGIIVALNEFPGATSPASILFAAQRDPAESNGEATVRFPSHARHADASTVTGERPTGKSDANAAPDHQAEPDHREDPTATTPPAGARNDFSWLSGGTKGSSTGSAQQPRHQTARGDQTVRAMSALRKSTEATPSISTGATETASKGTVTKGTVTEGMRPKDTPSGELPKRVPRAQLLPEQSAKSTAAPVRIAASRDPNRARGFLSSYQAGIRQSDDDTPGEKASGENTAGSAQSESAPSGNAWTGTNQQVGEQRAGRQQGEEHS